MSTANTAREPELNLYDYYEIRFGFQPNEQLKKLFVKTRMDSCAGKKYKVAIDAAVQLMESLDSQAFDLSIAELVTDYLASHMKKHKAFK